MEAVAFVLISLLALLFAFLNTNKLLPRWLEVKYVNWSRQKKWAYAIALSIPLIIVMPGITGVMIAIIYVAAFEKKDRFFSIKLRK